MYFDAKAKVHLKRYMEERQDNNEALFVTLDYPYNRLKISGVEIRLRALGRKLNLERIHPHKFRRTMATRAIDKGMPIEQVQKILGHSQIDTTMQYAMVNQANVKSSHTEYDELLHQIPKLQAAEIIHIDIQPLPEVEIQGIYAEVSMEKQEWKARIKEQVKQILRYKPEAVFVGENLFAAYPIVHALRKKHIPVLVPAEKDGQKLLIRIPSGS